MTKKQSQSEKAAEVKAAAEGKPIPEARGHARDGESPKPPKVDPPKLTPERKMTLLAACQLRIDGYEARAEQLKQELTSLKSQIKSAKVQLSEIIKDRGQGELEFTDDETE